MKNEIILMYLINDQKENILNIIANPIWSLQYKCIASFAPFRLYSIFSDFLRFFSYLVRNNLANHFQTDTRGNNGKNNKIKR